MDKIDKKIEKLFDLNKRLSDEIQLSLPSIIDSLGKTKFKYTSKALLSFIPKSGYLNSAILQLIANKNIYASAILYRSIIEHSFRHLYIYTKALKEDSDAIGQAYCNTLKGAEDLQYFDKVNKHNKSVDPSATIWNTKNDHNKEIRKAQDEFKFSKIVEYFKSEQNNNDNIKEYINNHLLERSVEYDNLSSAVHGGPFGENALFNLHKDKEKHDATLYKFANESIGLHHSIVESTYLFAYVVVSSDIKEHYEKIKALRN